MKPNILVTPRSLTSQQQHPALERLRQAGFEVICCTPGQQPDEAELLRLLPDCVGYLAGVEPITARVLAQATSLRAISRNGTGVNNIDLQAARQQGIEVLAAAGANARGVAELTIGLMLALIRSIPFADQQMKKGQWERRPGIELQGKVLGLVGCGRVGQQVAQIAHALGMDIWAHDPFADRSFVPPGNFRWGEISDLLAAADVVSLHCPPSPSGEPILDRAAIERMKDEAYLINTARWELMDDQAVLAGLEGGKLAGVAVDAYAAEPPGEHPLVLHPRVIATPHLGAYTRESVARAADVAVENLLCALQKSA